MRGEQRTLEAKRKCVAIGKRGATAVERHPLTRGGDESEREYCSAGVGGGVRGAGAVDAADAAGRLPIPRPHFFVRRVRIE